MKKLVKRLTYWALGLALVPLTLAVLHQVGQMLYNLGSEGVSTWWRYAAGAGIYILFERMISKPMWLYVFGHELTHALSGMMSGAKIHSFKATSKGGQVELSKSNAFIALSPYIIPLYAALVIAIYAAVRRYYTHPWLLPTFEGLLGLTLAFHISLTFTAFHKHQTDLKVLGFFLSAVLIILGNSLILGLLGVSLFKKTPTLSEFASRIGIETVAHCDRGWELAKLITHKVDVSWTH